MYYCAYGENINSKAMKTLCPNAKFIGTGIVYGYRLVFKDDADIIEDSSSHVQVVVWKISRRDMEALDKYEGYPLYKDIIRVGVDMGDGSFVSAAAYIMVDKNAPFEYPSSSYYNSMLDGYSEHMFDKENLVSALDESYYESFK